MSTALVIEPDGEEVSPHCDECGHMTKRIWGWFHEGEATRAGYLARWTEGHLERGAQIVLSIGRWGEGTAGQDRRRVAIECRMGEDRPAFMVVDAGDLDWCDDDEFFGAPVTRADVLAGPLAQESFAMLDLLTEHDERFRGFLLNGI